MAGKKAVVVGATGAIGQHVVGQLLTDTTGTWAEVVTVGRRPVTVPSVYKPEDYKAKLEQVTVNFDNFASEALPAMKGADSVFCCLGTTRKDAGSAEAFLKLEYDYVKSAIETAKAAGTQHFSLVSAVGANANLWANNLALFHALLYSKTKGQTEELAKAQGFPSLSIYRPGLLDRGEKARFWEKQFLWSGSIAVQGVAKLMILDAEASPRPKQNTYEMSLLQKALKQSVAPAHCSSKGP